MKPERLHARVAVDMLRWRFGKRVAVYRRRTWFPKDEHWVTDYGVEVLGLTVWVHLPRVADPDDCCCKGHDAES